MDTSILMEMAKVVSNSSSCLKKQLGCVLYLQDNTVIIGTNGPPAKIKKCKMCQSKEGKCRAVHAERQVLLKAAKRGLITKDAILYSYMGVPCKDCLLELIEAGISKIVCIKHTYHDEFSKEILKEWINSGGQFEIYEVK